MLTPRAGRRFRVAYRHDPVTRIDYGHDLPLAGDNGQMVFVLPPAEWNDGPTQSAIAVGRTAHAAGARLRRADVAISGIEAYVSGAQSD